MHGSDQSYRRNNGGGTLCHAGSALRGEASPAHHISRAGSIQRRKTAPTVLSLDMLPEDVADSSWLLSITTSKLNIRPGVAQKSALACSL